jgi:hypothetical protein
VRLNAGDDHRVYAEVVKKERELCGIESRVLWLQHEVVVILGVKNLRQWSSGNAVAENVIENLIQVRLPPAEVVVGIHRGNSGALRASLERRDVVRHRKGLLEQLRPVIEVERIDHVDHHQRDWRLIWRVAMEVGISSHRSGHR